MFLFGSSKDIILSPVSTRCPLVSLLTQIWELGRSVLPALLGSGQLLAPTRGRVGRLFKKLLKKVRRDGEVGTTTTVYQARWRLVCALVVRRRHTRHPPWEWGYWGGSQLANTYKDRSYGGSDHTLLRKFSEDRFSWTVRERERERDICQLSGKMNKLVILGFLAASATAVPTSVVNNVQLNRDLDCFEQENALFSCISVKTVSMLDRAARSSDIEIIDGVKFVRETPSEFQPFVY